MEKEFKELRDFLSVFWSYKKDKITINKSLDDLGMYGDDKRDFLKSFVEKFNVNFSDLNYDKFCEPERFNPLKRIFIKSKNEEKTIITIEHLINVIKRKEWFYPL